MEIYGMKLDYLGQEMVYLIILKIQIQMILIM